MLVVHHVFRPDDSRQALEVGALLPAHATALGKVLLASNRYAAAELAAAGLPRYTPATLTDWDALDGELRAVQERGWAVDAEELEAGVVSLAAPIQDRRGVTVGAIGISGPVERMSERGRAADRPRRRTCARRRAPCRATSGRSRGDARETGRKEPVRERYIASVDQGTASSRCLIFDHEGRVVSVSQVEHRQIVPAPGRVEHDPVEIWNNVQYVVATALATADLRVSDLVGLGLTNQRETTVLWDRATGTPVHNAINWQDMRTDHLVRELAGDAGPDRFRERCGLPLATYFSGPKIRWLLDHVDGLRERAEAGDVLFGTMDSWLIWKLTGRHLTDVTNAGRTMLMNLDTLEWDDVLLDGIGVPRAMLPEIRPSMEVYGEAGGSLAGLPVAAALGDQHAALFGQACFAPGDAKCTYGTGSFMLMNTGEQPVHSTNGLLTTVGYKIGDQPATYALEGSIAVTGALVQWFRDKLGLIGSASEIETLARSVDDNGGCYFVPAFSGLFAPHWRDDARGVIAGLTGYISKGHLARAVLEATAWQTREVVDAMNGEAGVSVTSLKVDGGMTANHLLMQSLADVLDVPVVRPIVAEAPSLGAAYAAGLAVGFWPDVETLRAQWHKAAEWLPAMEPAVREKGYRKWRKAVARTVDWVDEDDD